MKTPQDYKDYTCDEINAELDEVLNEIERDDEQFQAQQKGNNDNKR